MAEVDEFLQSALPKLIEADTALHNGDAARRAIGALFGGGSRIHDAGVAPTRT